MDTNLKSEINPLGNIRPVSPAAKERIIHEKEEQEKGQKKDKKKEGKEDKKRDTDRFESQVDDNPEPKIIPQKHKKDGDSSLGGIIDITVE